MVFGRDFLCIAVFSTAAVWLCSVFAAVLYDLAAVRYNIFNSAAYEGDSTLVVGDNTVDHASVEDPAGVCDAAGGYNLAVLGLAVRGILV